MDKQRPADDPPAEQLPTFDERVTNVYHDVRELLAGVSGIRGIEVGATELVVLIDDEWLEGEVMRRVQSLPTTLRIRCELSRPSLAWLPHSTRPAHR